MSDSREAFIKQLMDHRPAVADFIWRAERNQIEQLDKDNLHRRAQAMASGRTFGYEKISDAAQAMEAALAATSGDEALLAPARALYAACHEALVVHPVAMPENAPNASAPTAKKFTILSADDDRLVHALIEKLFENEAHIIIAHTGREALEAIRRHRPDLVLLDDMMPEMSGMAVLEAVAADPELHPFIVMLTSSDRPRDFERASKAGAADYVVKPFDPNILTGKVRALLQRKQ